MKTLILKILPIGLMLIWAGAIHAQINTTAGSVTSCPGDTVVPINVTNCNGIGAISLVLTFDNTKLTYLSFLDLNPALTGGMLMINSAGNKVIISWIRTTAANLGNSTLVKLKFNATTSTTTLAWDTQTPGNCEYSDVLGNILPSTYTNGTVTINQPPAINTQPVNQTALVGQNPSFSVSASGTNLTYLWQRSTDGGTIWADLTNTAPYSGVTTSTLTITNALLTYNGHKFRCKLKGRCTPEITSYVVTLTVIYPITTTLPTPATGFCPGSITAPVTVTNFTGVAAFSLTFSYNPYCLTYTGYQTLNGALSGGNFVINASGGYVYMTWSSTTAATFGNGTLVELLFTGVAGTSPLVWDVATEGNCEYTTLSGAEITPVFVNGSETIYALPTVTVHPTNKTIAKGQNTTFSVTATGSGLSYIWQYSANNGVSFYDLTNSGYYSNVTTPTMTVTGAQLAITGYQYRCKVTGYCTPIAFSNPATLTVLPNVITTCGTGTICPGPVALAVKVTDFIGVASFSLTLNFDPSILSYTGYDSLNTAVSGGMFSANAVGGKLYLTWSNTVAATIAGGKTLLRVKFNGTPGTSALNWDTQTVGNCEYSDLSGQVIFSTWNNGSVTINSPPAITTQPLNQTIYAGGSTTFYAGATGTGIGYSWQLSTNNGTTWSNLTGVSPYSGVNSATLTINPAATGMNGYRYRCIVSGTCPPSDTTNSVQLTVTQAAITTTPGTVANSCSGTVNVPVNVTSCLNVGSISLTLVFDTAKMSFLSHHSVNAALSVGMLAVNSVDNKVYLTWSSTTAINPGNATLIQFRFNAKAGISTTVSWDTQTTGACEYADPNGTVITSFYNTSNISTSATALIVDAGPDVIKTGASVQLNGTATGQTTPYTWLWSPAGSLNNPAIQNPIASPAATTTYTLTVTAFNGCVGSDAMNVIVGGVIPDNRSVQGITVTNGVTVCYDAYQVITVAGSGTIFLVQNGGSATLIAGQKISFLTGTTVNSGGYLHGYITTNGQYCNTSSPPMVATAINENEIVIPDGDLFNVYPNPTSGSFRVKINEKIIPGKSTVTLYGNLGEPVFTTETDALTGQEFSLSGRPAGVYFIRVCRGSVQQTKKIIKQ
jgi:hypothetical protein